MADINGISRFSNEGSNPVPVNRLTEYFRNPLREPLECLEPPVGQASRLSVEAPHTPRLARPSSESSPSFWESYSGTMWARPGQRQPLTEEDTRIHAWLNERLAALHYERYGLWPRANRLFRSIARFVLWPFGYKERFNAD
jgi:hypothetical protein